MVDRKAYVLKASPDPRGKYINGSDEEFTSRELSQARSAGKSAQWQMVCEVYVTGIVGACPAHSTCVAGDNRHE